MNTKIMSKRTKIMQASSTMFVAVAVAAVVVAFSLVSLRFLWQKKSYNDRVISAKTKARNQVEQNVTNLDKLSQLYPDLNSGSINSTTILHALPPTYDYAALASTVEALARRSGVSFSGAIGEDASDNAVASAATSTPVEIPLTIQVTGNYDAIKKFLGNLEKSIRPVNVATVTYSGTNSTLRATITASTYYQPVRDLEPGKETVQ